MPTPVPREETVNPQTKLMLEDISSRLSSEESGVRTKSGRINSKGREIADDVYQRSLSRNNGSFKQVLKRCGEEESILNTADPDSEDIETAKIIQSIRGKVVYNAHRVWVEKQMNLDAYGMKDLSAPNVMKYARTLKEDKKLDVYEEASNLEKERAEINEQLRLSSEELLGENDAILETDIESVTKGLPPHERKQILNEIKSKLGTFTKKALEPETRRKVVAATLSTLAVSGVALGYIKSIKINESRKEAMLKAMSKPQAGQVEKTPDAIISEIENEFLDDDSEIPEVVFEEVIIGGQPQRSGVAKQESIVTITEFSPELNHWQESFIFQSAVPVRFINETMNPGGTARPAHHLAENSVIWNHSDEWLPVQESDLPEKIDELSAENYLNILKWNNVDNPENIRYAATENNTFCNVAVYDWATAYRFEGQDYSAPIPRWMDGSKVTSNYLYDWLQSENATHLGWRAVDAETAQGYANRGFFTVGVVKNNLGGPGHIVAVAPGNGSVGEDSVTFYPVTAQAGKENWGPDSGNTAEDSFNFENPDFFAEPMYFTWDVTNEIVQQESYDHIAQ